MFADVLDVFMNMHNVSIDMYSWMCMYFCICIFLCMHLFVHLCIYLCICVCFLHDFQREVDEFRAWCDFEGTSRRKLLQMCSQKCGLKDATVSRNIIRSCAFGRQTPNREAIRALLQFFAVFFIFMLPSVVQSGRCAWYRINSHLEKSDTSTKEFSESQLSSRFRAILVPFLGRL